MQSWKKGNYMLTQIYSFSSIIGCRHVSGHFKPLAERLESIIYLIFCFSWNDKVCWSDTFSGPLGGHFTIWTGFYTTRFLGLLSQKSFCSLMKVLVSLSVFFSLFFCYFYVVEICVIWFLISWRRGRRWRQRALTIELSSKNINNFRSLLRRLGKVYCEWTFKCTI